MAHPIHSAHCGFEKKYRSLIILLLLAVVAGIIYSNTFSSPFHFDDMPNIVDNPHIKNPANFLDFSGTRSVGFLSFALNYRFGGLNVFGYHLVNLLIHITNGFLVYSLVLLLFRAHSMGGIGGSAGSPPDWSRSIRLCRGEADWIALATALLFISHPIQTQAVTYIVQRFASLVTLFYLLAVVCYLKWRLASPDGRGRYLWYGTALLSTLLAMKTKENSFTLPLMIFLVEAAFFRPLTMKRWGTLIPFLLTLSMIPLSQVNALGEAEGFARDTAEIGRLDYLFTQFRVIVTYLRLLVLPINQNLDYDYPVYHSLLTPPVFVSFLFLLSLAGFAVSSLFHSRLKLISFGILWFLLALSIESSIIPIEDVIFEHRLYLPSVGLFISFSGGLATSRTWISPKWSMVGMGIVILLFSLAAYQRNALWKDELTLWRDVVAKAPHKARGYVGLGAAFHEKGMLEAAIREYQTALRLQPNHYVTHHSLGLAYAAQGRWEDAINEYKGALKQVPDFAWAHVSLGNAYAAMKRFDEALLEYLTALKIRPDDPKVHFNMGNVHAAQGRWDEAIQEYQNSLRLNPDYVDAHNNLGNVYAAQGNWEAAIQEYQATLRLRPNDAEVRKNLDNAHRHKDGSR